MMLLLVAAVLFAGGAGVAVLRPDRLPWTAAAISGGLCLMTIAFLTAR